MAENAKLSKKSSFISQQHSTPGTLQPNNQAILSLQRTLGNQNFRRYIARSPERHRPRSSADKDNSVAASPRFSPVVSEIFSFFKNTANDKLTFEQFADYLLERMNTVVQGPPSKPLTRAPSDSPASTLGVFLHWDWAIEMNTGTFATLNPEATTLEGLTYNEVATIVGTVCHEVYHAEQFYLIARLLAGKGKSASQIKAHVNIPLNVANDAKADPLGPNASNPGNAAVIDAARQWEKATRGEYKELFKRTADVREFIRELPVYPDGITKENLAEAKKGLKEMFYWWNKTTLPEIKGYYNIIKAKKSKTEMDKLILERVKRMIAVLKSSLSQWKTDTVRSEETLATLNDPLLELVNISVDLYKISAHEHDAIAVGNAMEDEFKDLVAARNPHAP